MRQQQEQAASAVRPNIITQRCIGCKTCIKHCRKDVFAFDPSTRKISVKGSNGCHEGCRTCARVCLSGAVTFPDEEAFVRYLNGRLEQINDGLSCVGAFLITTESQAFVDGAR